MDCWNWMSLLRISGREREMTIIKPRTLMMLRRMRADKPRRIERKIRLRGEAFWPRAFLRRLGRPDK